jgi:hypothetical protein
MGGHNETYHHAQRGQSQAGTAVSCPYNSPESYTFQAWVPGGFSYHPGSSS